MLASSKANINTCERPPKQPRGGQLSKTPHGSRPPSHLDQAQGFQSKHTKAFGSL